jgi:hypothetical protein
MLRYFNLVVVLLPDPAVPCRSGVPRLAAGRRNDQSERHTPAFRLGVQSAPAGGRFCSSMYWRKIEIGAPPTDPAK